MLPLVSALVSLTLTALLIAKCCYKADRIEKEEEQTPAKLPLSEVVVITEPILVSKIDTPVCSEKDLEVPDPILKLDTPEPSEKSQEF